MVNNVGEINGAVHQILEGKNTGAAKTVEEGKTFSHVLKDSLQEVNRLQGEADKSIKDLAIGKNGNIHETMIALEKADISFRLMMQIRNKILDAYTEIMRTQI